MHEAEAACVAHLPPHSLDPSLRTRVTKYGTSCPGLMFAVRYLKSTKLPGREQTVAQMMEAQHREDTEAETSAQAAALGNMARVRVRDIGGG